MRETSAGNDAYDVAVIGYGPTGVSAANLLGAMGLRVVVLERDAEVYSRARAISTDEEVLRIWQRVGLAERLKRDMLTDRPVDFVDARGRSFIRARPTPRGHGHPPQMFIYQPALEEVLREGVARYPNVEVRLGHECVGLRQDSEGVGLTATAGDAVHRLRAAYVIAADGGSSPTRARLGVGYEGRTYEDRWVVVDTAMLKPWPGHDRLRFRCDPARPAVDCPTPLGHHRWEFPVLPSDDESYLTTDEAVLTLVTRYGIGPDNIRILRSTVYSHHVRVAARFRAGRVFFAGDAAHAMPPWIGQGMAAGVRDVANLCWKLAAVLRGELPETVLDSYEAERKPHVKEVTGRAVFVGRIITERRPPVTRLRDTVLPVLNRVPGFAQWLQDSHWIPVARYSAGLQARPRTRASGRQIPQPRVTAPDGTRVRLDDALGGRWLLLHARTATPQPLWNVPSLTVTPAGSSPARGTLVDSDGVLLPWLAGHRAATLALRPDAYVYAAAREGASLPPPPAGFAPVPHPTVTSSG
ncbi:bifunctional 3-(3-hydroxy-phenyl)propionate/3-hydroxycinnamic acid hydroxylase [Streptomyces ipomoeae]|uniref:bifunctional 3-(3-hydroxy-phenyl)propionate/3-hydroxycinnamic acid hydroxylase n=1 Tax=Streptomyces ipomoeae TaxID=103232 RepID=UPI0011479635|nr:bifunctional 3-(3-hydroxy-phenyl)propionate/3-hydroxycinnamic acid hydroxylase [Streptomyces ipomoeae]MDX2931245.1 bifunctional 3-(3-hydroxy-phenyl)propionate/3-hydroxycinnamic acid hydroxylase [Streptomyces ipomoeae]TQE16225.1 bifunctional 3-(3-hydroxy-phenyl)propionate/3-hydroxycinnamic acid hydroxylase [Streptomyces ipomoeae]